MFLFIPRYIMCFCVLVTSVSVIARHELLRAWIGLCTATSIILSRSWLHSGFVDVDGLISSFHEEDESKVNQVGDDSRVYDVSTASFS